MTANKLLQKSTEIECTALYLRTFHLTLVILFFGITISSTAQDVPLESDFQWKMPGGKYVDPTSFFSLHGYVDGVFAGGSPDWTTSNPTWPGMPGQVLVPNKNNSSFQFDAGLFIASEISKRTRLLIEMHLVTDPGVKGMAGPGGLTFVLTEATGSWDLLPKYMTVSGGLYWAPFGIVNQDWLGAQNLFTLMPMASGAFPAHWNERGIRINGAIAFGKKSAINYAISVGNGYQAYSIMGQTGHDQNEDKTVMGRVGIFPGLGKSLDIGFSFASGTLREGADTSRAETDANRYASSFIATGMDGTAKFKGLKARSYFIYSIEALAAVDANTIDPQDLERMGLMVEASYLIKFKKKIIGIESISPKFRFDWVSIDHLEGLPDERKGYKSSTYSIGMNININAQFYFSFDYNFLNELNFDDLSNDRFIARLTAQF